MEEMVRSHNNCLSCALPEGAESVRFWISSNSKCCIQRSSRTCPAHKMDLRPVLQYRRRRLSFNAAGNPCMPTKINLLKSVAKRSQKAGRCKIAKGRCNLEYPSSSPNTLPCPDEGRVLEMFTSLGTPESFASGSSAFVPLPGFIHPYPTTISVDRIEYLQAQGALTLPTIALQNALLHKFVECVLPYMPVLEWPGFINTINARDGSQGQVSLLLFQAVLFSATTFVELEYLLEAGYSSREEAHEGFFEKSKSLYDAGYESDALVVVQSLLLLTHRSDAGVGSGAHWCELAISVAQSIRLFHDQASTDSSVYSSKLWRKVGWACYMTDCLIALQLRRRPRIKRESFGHQMLTPDDFDIVLGPESTLPTVETQGQLNLGSIAQSRLCLCISEVLEIQGRNDQLNWSIVNSPNHENDYIVRVTRADKALEDWMVSLPYSCKYRLAGSGEPPAIFVQRSLLHMVYHTTTCVLHQSQTFWSSKARVQHAAGQITQLAVELHNGNLHNWLPRIGVTAILVAMIVHISQIQSVRPPERRELMNSFESCITVMASLQDIHSETKAVTACMLQTMKATMDRNSGSNNDNYSTSFTATPSEARSKLNSECKNETLEDWDMYLTI